MDKAVLAERVEIKCKICDVVKDKEVPTLTCKHYICPACYVSMKSHKQNECVLCKKNMRRILYRI